MDNKVFIINARCKHEERTHKFSSTNLVDITPHCISATEGRRTKFNHCSCHVTSRRVVTYSVNFSGLCAPCIVCSTNSVLTGPPLRSASSFIPSLVVYLIESVVHLRYNKNYSLDPMSFAAILRACDHVRKVLPIVSSVEESLLTESFTGQQTKRLLKAH